MLGWLKSKAQKSITDTMRDDIQRFIETLRGTSSSEKGALLVMATIIRKRNLPGLGIPDNAFDLGSYSGSYEEDLVALKINRLIKEFQKQGDPTSAAGAMVWLHSIRAIQNPQLRLLGRQMWGELSRGAPFAYENASMIAPAFERDYDADLIARASDYIPDGLEPEVR